MEEVLSQWEGVVMVDGGLPSGRMIIGGPTTITMLLTIALAVLR